LDGDYDIGALPVGDGSGSGRFASIVSPLGAIKNRAESYGALVQYITSNDAIMRGSLSSLAPLPLDVCTVFLKFWASEGDDRATLLAGWNSTQVVESVATLCLNTVVVLYGAAPNVLPWANHPNVTAIIVAHFPGQDIGNAITDIHWGDINPSGRLPYTIAHEELDYNKNIVNSTELHHTTDPNAWNADFLGGNLIDYKWFDAKNASVAFEFGFGMSYTTFELRDLQTRLLVPEPSREPDDGAAVLPGGNVELWEIIATASVTVQNTGVIAGSAIPQLYLSYPPEAGAPVKSLRGFEKVHLEAGASEILHFSLTRRDVSYWNTVAQNWSLPKGNM
jgi:beta-glucosidase